MSQVVITNPVINTLFDEQARHFRFTDEGIANDIACWFIDTNYNGERFFVLHAYFTGAEEPYEKLKRALKADIDESAWASLYSTISHPFDPPDTGKIAIKVIDFYEDEVLEVFRIGSMLS